MRHKKISDRELRTFFDVHREIKACIETGQLVIDETGKVYRVVGVPPHLFLMVNVIDIDSLLEETVAVGSLRLRILSPLEQLASQAEPAPPSDCECPSEPL